MMSAPVFVSFFPRTEAVEVEVGRTEAPGLVSVPVGETDGDGEVGVGLGEVGVEVGVEGDGDGDDVCSTS